MLSTDPLGTKTNPHETQNSQQAKKMSSDFANSIFHVLFDDRRMRRRNLKLFNCSTARTPSLGIRLSNKKYAKNSEEWQCRVQAKTSKKSHFSVEELKCFIDNRIPRKSYSDNAFERPFRPERPAMLHAFLFIFLFFSFDDWVSEMLTSLLAIHAHWLPYNNQLVHRTEQWNSREAAEVRSKRSKSKRRRKW